MEELKIWIPLLIAIIGLIGGAILYNVQKAVDRKNQIHQERREVYRRFVLSFNEVRQLTRVSEDQGPQIVAIHELEKVCAEIAVTAPDKVVESCQDFFSLFIDYGVANYPGNGGERDSDKVSAALTKIDEQYLEEISAMREDSFENTLVSKVMLTKILESFAFSIGRFP